MNIMEDRAGRPRARRGRALHQAAPARGRSPRASCCSASSSEIFMRATGFNGGMGGSMHAFFPPFGAYPNNAIVGASAGIATGAALRKKLAGEGGIAVAFAGDGVDRLRPGLRGDELRRHGAVRPAVAGALQGRPAGALLLHQQFLRHGRPDQRRDHGLGPPVADRRRRQSRPTSTPRPSTAPIRSPSPMRSRRQARAARRRARARPCSTSRPTASPAIRRPTPTPTARREEMQAWSAARSDRGPCRRTPRGGHPRRGRRRGAPRRGRSELIRAVTAAAVDPEAAPVDRHRGATDADRRADVLHTGARDLPAPIRRSPRPRPPSTHLRQLGKKSRSALGADGAKLSPMRAITVRDALFEAILHHFIHDPTR